MSEKHTSARISVGNEKFEILVKPGQALDFVMGKTTDLSDILVVDEIFLDAKKGMKASEKRLSVAFGTENAQEIAEKILRDGELQLTTTQRRQLIEQKRRQIVAFISRHCMDPRTKLPHPPKRIEQAMEEAKLSIDPFKESEDQARDVIQELRPILPISMEELRIAVKIPAEYAPKAYGTVKDFGRIEREEWQVDGSWVAVIEMPVGLHGPFLERLGRITQGTMQTKTLK
ncbi:ribosome assembly factor SBDS [Candidatus Bathyarchaeota archaeon]|nr:ribosome assembly factor SBDS [Candidatus Bathyarchaeota archaeon]